jgi:hypothetical protein
MNLRHAINVVCVDSEMSVTSAPSGDHGHYHFIFLCDILMSFCHGIFDIGLRTN